MASFNKVILAGNLTRDPELRTAGTGGAKVATFGLAVNEVFRDKNTGALAERPVFVDVDVWDKQAENAAQHLRKGRNILVEGRLQMDAWEKDGQIRRKTEVVAENIQILYRPEQYRNQQSAASSQPADEAAEAINDEAQAAPEAQGQGGFFDGLFRN